MLVSMKSGEGCPPLVKMPGWRSNVVPSMRFMGGEPTKVATKVFAGRS